jgi:hypothetical protein
MRKVILTIGCFLLLFSFTPAQAVPITIEITGNVTFASGLGTIHAGDTFTGTYTYESSTIDSGGGYYWYDAPYGISLSFQDYVFATNPNQVHSFDILIWDDVHVNTPIYDRYCIDSSQIISTPSSGLTIDYISWDLWDSTHTALSSGSLPLTAPVLTAWDLNHLVISGYDHLGGHGISIGGMVTQAVLIPEPATIALIMMGVFFSKLRR